MLKTVVLISPPFNGHIQPMIYLAKQLRKRFHCRSVIVTSISAQHKICYNDVVFLDDNVPNSPSAKCGHMTMQLNMLRNGILNHVKELRPNLVVSDVWVHAADTVASHLKVPMVVLQPCNISFVEKFSNLHLSDFDDFPVYPKSAIYEPEIDYMPNYIINNIELMKKYKIMCLSLFDGFNTSPDDQKQIQPLGLATYDDQFLLMCSACDFINSDPNTEYIYVTFGSTQRKPDISVLLSEFGKSKYKFVISYDLKITSHIPENCFVYEWVDQTRLLRIENVVAVVSHCGWGGISQAISSCTPIIGLAHQNDLIDQYDNAQLIDNYHLGFHCFIWNTINEYITKLIENKNDIIQNMRKINKVNEAFKSEQIYKNFCLYLEK